MKGWRTRPLVVGDFELTFAWRTDPAVCANAIDRRPPTRAMHSDWMDARLAGGMPVTRLVSYGEHDVGMFTVLHVPEAVSCSIGYMVAPEHRGLGRAKGVRGCALIAARELYPDAIFLQSSIRLENTRSLVTALKAGAILKRVVEGFALLEQAL